jgi:sugar lactone lactonase YvrE
MPMAIRAEPVPDVRGELLESPAWDDRRRLLWLVDIVGRLVLGVDPDGASDHVVHHRFPMPSEPGSLALAADGSLVVALRDQVARLDVATGTLSTLAPAEHDPKTTRLNDGRCDFRGRFWVGSMYEPRDKATAALYRLDGDRLVPEVTGITLANGLAFDPDGRGGWHADTPARVVWRFEFDAAGGIRERRPFLTLGPDARPDGATTDAEGAYWLCAIDAGEVRRYRRDGTPDRRVAVPTPWPTMPAFGGPDLKTCFVTSLRVGRDPGQLAAAPLSGALFRFRSEIAGVPEPRVAL